MNAASYLDPMSRCPHCGSLSRIDGSGASAVCSVCGGARIVGDAGGEKAAAALREERKLRENARVASFATILQGVFATFATLMALAISPVTLAGKLLALGIAIVPTILALRSRSRASQARTRAAEAHRRVLLAAAEEIAQTSDAGVTPSELGKKLAIDAELAEKLLTELAVEDRTRIDVGGDAEVRYSVAPEDKRVRVAATHVGEAQVGGPQVGEPQEEAESVESELAAFDAKLEAAGRGTK